MPRHVFELFITGRTRQSDRAIRNLRGYCADVPELDCELTIIDVLEQPERAEERHILATPTLIRLSPPPVLRIIGDLSDHEVFRRAIGLPGDADAPSQTHNDGDPDHD